MGTASYSAKLLVRGYLISTSTCVSVIIRLLQQVTRPWWSSVSEVDRNLAATSPGNEITNYFVQRVIVRLHLTHISVIYLLIFCTATSGGHTSLGDGDMRFAPMRCVLANLGHGNLIIFKLLGMANRRIGRYYGSCRVIELI